MEGPEFRFPENIRIAWCGNAILYLSVTKKVKTGLLENLNAISRIHMVEEETEFCKLCPDFHKCGVIGAFLFCTIRLNVKSNDKKFQAQPSILLCYSSH